MNMKLPPKWMIKTLENVCPEHLTDEIEGDFLENYTYQSEKKGTGYANRQALVFIIFSLPKLLFARRYKTTNNIDMLRNYLKVAIRNLLKNKGFSFINISGLAIGLACCFLIGLYVQFELSYESFHSKKESIYRYIPRSSDDGGNLRMQTWTPPGFAPAVADHFSEISQYTRYSTLSDEPLLTVEDKVLPPDILALGDIGFFNIFSIDLVRGDKNEVLKSPYSLVISQSIADNFFPGEDPVGKVIRYDNSYDFNITGVFEDLPSNTHLNFSYIVPFETIGDIVEDQFGYPKDKLLEGLDSWNYSSYFVIDSDVNSIEFESRVDEQFTKLRKGTFNPESVHDWLQPLQEIHFTKGIRGDEANGDINTVYIFSAIAIFILIIACFNFMNLSTARAMKRAKEVGVRKVMGAQRPQLVYQFLGETVLLTIIALVFSIFILELTIPSFNSTMGMSLSPNYLDNPMFLITLIGIGLLTGVIAGGYPAFYLSSFEAAKVLKDTSNRSGKSTLRQVLTILQFGIAAFLIIGTFVVSQQMNFLTNKSLGFQKEEIIYFLPPTSLFDDVDVLMNNLKANSAVVGVSRSNGVPGYTGSHWTYNLPDEEIKENINTMIIDYDFLDNYEIEIVEGRNISSDFATDSSDAYLINETAVRQLMLVNPIGTRIQALDGHGVGRIVGVVKDFHYKSLHQAIEPLVLRHDPRNSYTLSVRMKEGNLQNNLRAIEQEWKKIASDYPFNYSFLDDDLEQLYKSEENVGLLMTTFSFLAIFIACLGLLGLISFMTEQRKKEIGVRKVLGATVASIVGLLGKDFAILVVIAFIISIPASWWAMNLWLENFAYKIDINPFLYVFAGVVLLLIALATVSYQSFRAATSNPVDTLRSE